MTPEVVPEIEILWSKDSVASCTVMDLDFYERLGEQIQPCSFLPGPKLLSTIVSWYEDDDFREVDPDSVKIGNVERAYVGLDDQWVGYDFLVQFILREREGLVF